MRKLAALTLIACSLGVVNNAEAKDLLLAYVNLQRAIVEVDEGKRAKDQLKKTFEKKQKLLSEREQELKTLKDAIDKESVLAKDDAATRQRKVEFQNKLMALQETFMQEQQELKLLEQKELAAITKKMKKVIEEIGAKGGYTLILEIQDSRLLYAQPHLDLTNEVIRKYNAIYK